MAAKQSPKGALSHLAIDGAEIAVRVTPNAGQSGVVDTPEGLRVRTTAVPDGGKANADVTKQLARALGVAKSRLTLVRGHTARDKLFRLDA